MKKIILLILIIPLVYLSGCIFGDYDYAIAKEQYAIGWILHNVNDSTSTDLSYSLSDLAVYNYSYDYPAGEPYYYYNYFTFLSPVPKGMTELTLILGNKLAVPLNRTYFVMGVNPAPENYETNWSFYNEMEIDYFGSYAPERLEQYNSTNVFHAITPKPGQTLSVTFGKAPFTPTSFIVNDSLKLGDYLLKGYIPRAYLWRDTGSYYGKKLVPVYEIYLNNFLVDRGNATDSNGFWNHTLLNYSLTSSGTYFVNLTIPSGYPVWNITKLEATFYIPSDDKQPPVLNHIEAKPYFEHNKQYNISINITDDNAIKSVLAYYREGSDWISLPLDYNSGLYKTSLTISNLSVGGFDFKISANDTSDNQINYTISPLALLGRGVSLTLSIDHNETIKGGSIPVSGTIESNGKDMSRFMVNLFLDDREVGNAMSRNGTYFGYAKLNCSPPSIINVTAKFLGTGIYMSNETFDETSINIVPLNFSVDEVVPVHYTSIIDASGVGAYITINKSSWFYSGFMKDKIFLFTPRRYGNYTITLNTSCDESVNKIVFSNITSKPSILDAFTYPEVPMNDTSFYIIFSTESQDQHNLVGNITNNSMNSPLNLTFDNYYALDSDYYTREIYNLTECLYCWRATIDGLSKGIYNLSLELSDAINQTDTRNLTIYVYPSMRMKFNLTDMNGNPATRYVQLGINSFNDIFYGTVNGYRDLGQVPNISYFNKTAIITIENYNYSSYDKQKITFLNSTISENMKMASQYIENRTVLPDKILYSFYIFNQSWNYSKMDVEFRYRNISRFGMYNSSKSTLYACKSYNFQQKRCTGSWVNITSYFYPIYYYTYVSGHTDDSQAFAFGEPQGCVENWSCTEWSECSNGVQTRSCTDLNNCGTTLNKPATSRSCTVEPPVGPPAGCVENWSCTEWSECSNGVQTRECRDLNNCGTVLRRPATSQSCTVEPPSQPQKTDCPFECCINENDYFDKLCPADKYCINHICTVKETEGSKEGGKNFKLLLIVGSSAAVLSLVVFVSFKLFRKKSTAPVTFTEDLDATLEELSSEINSLKRFYDVSKLEAELNLARNALKYGLKELTKTHIENIRKLKEQIH